MSDDTDLYEQGLAVRREVLGAEYVDRSIAAASEFTKPMQELVTEYCWGAVWSPRRPAPCDAQPVEHRDADGAQPPA